MLRNRIKSASKTRRVKEERKRALDIVSVSVFVRFVCYLPTRIDSPPPPQKKKTQTQREPNKDNNNHYNNNNRARCRLIYFQKEKNCLVNLDFNKCKRFTKCTSNSWVTCHAQFTESCFLLIYVWLVLSLTIFYPSRLFWSILSLLRSNYLFYIHFTKQIFMYFIYIYVFSNYLRITYLSWKNQTTMHLRPDAFRSAVISLTSVAVMCFTAIIPTPELVICGCKKLWMVIDLAGDLITPLAVWWMKFLQIFELFYAELALSIQTKHTLKAVTHSDKIRRVSCRAADSGVRF